MRERWDSNEADLNSVSVEKTLDYGLGLSRKGGDRGDSGVVQGLPTNKGLTRGFRFTGGHGGLVESLEPYQWKVKGGNWFRLSILLCSYTSDEGRR